MLLDLSRLDYALGELGSGGTPLEVGILGGVAVSDNSNVTTIVTQNVNVPFDLTGCALLPGNAGFALDDATTGRLEYVGASAFAGQLTIALSTRTDAIVTNTYSLRVYKNGVDLPIPPVASHTFTVSPNGWGLTAPVELVNGDTLEARIECDDGTQDLVAAYYSMTIR